MNVYDFDDTIFDGDSSIQFILEFLKTDPSIVKYLPGIFKVFILYQQGKFTMEDFYKTADRVLRNYCENCNVEIEPLVKKFWDKRMHRIKRFYKDIQRSDDVIITASPSFMMEELCKRIGVKHLICTDFDFSTGIVHRACYREEKVPMFFERFPGATIDKFYTDSMNDQFLFPYAKEIYIVKGNTITKKEI